MIVFDSNLFTCTALNSISVWLDSSIEISIHVNLGCNVLKLESRFDRTYFYQITLNRFRFIFWIQGVTIKTLEAMDKSFDTAAYQHPSQPLSRYKQHYSTLQNTAPIGWCQQISILNRSFRFTRPFIKLFFSIFSDISASTPLTSLNRTDLNHKFNNSNPWERKTFSHSAESSLYSTVHTTINRTGCIIFTCSHLDTT